ncbi:gamma-glutamyl-gamma-aminobutyrate hydrolase family protein [Plantibacter sp. YIM 135249]|uniref:gamma-glutamyl-gamma-aminobutyrate hydrolase family protein n=1 Tax=Plantibacter sp. YIM 135249 TaxID=3423918 RepID=UPI003D33F754
MQGHVSPLLALVEVTRFREDDQAYHDYVQVLVGRTIAAAERAGWRVSRLAAADLGEETLLSATESASAIVIMGGADIDPIHYGGRSGYRGEGQHFERADVAQLALARRAVERQTPLLGICRGHQIINVALGGTLVQDLGEHTTHRNEGVPVDQIMTSHSVELSPTSALAFRLGHRTVQVQSAHHQSVDRLGAGLRAVGWSSDGTIEAIEHETLPITGVQWHPEDPGTTDEQLSLLLGGLAREAERAAA